MQIVWREKLLAFLVHFLVTLVLAGIAAALIFLIWFPDPFQTMIGGTQLFLLVLGCDLVLGPLMSLVIYNSKKSRRHLMLDYAVVGVVQFAALVYGVYVVSASRPAYVAFVKDRLEVVRALELGPDELQAAEPEYRSIPRWGPKFVGTHVPQEEQSDAFFAALGGIDIGVRPRFYVPYDSQREKIKSASKPLSALTERHANAGALVEEAKHTLDISLEEVRWLPIKHHAGFWTVLIDSSDGEPVGYLELDPY